LLSVPGLILRATGVAAAFSAGCPAPSAAGPNSARFECALGTYGSENGASAHGVLVAIAERKRVRSVALFAQSLRVSQARGDQRGVAECVIGFACLAAANVQCTHAARLFGAAADAALKALGSELSPSNRAYYARGVNLARGRDKAAFDAAYAAGRQVSLDEAVHEALEATASTNEQ
jgi:hypothetical protein